jgi:hypothetical protein
MNGNASGPDISHDAFIQCNGFRPPGAMVDPVFEVEPLGCLLSNILALSGACVCDQIRPDPGRRKSSSHPLPLHRQSHDASSRRQACPNFPSLTLTSTFTLIVLQSGGFWHHHW